MKIEINPDRDHIKWERISEIFLLINWGVRIPEDVKASFLTSSYICIVTESNEIIGFGRTVDDGKYYANLVDVAIHPDFQGKGIGKQVVKALTDQLVGYQFITLTAAPGKAGFYEKLGWLNQKSAYLIPKDEKQIKEHCE
jgi:ribosomal protein S18 acetylase RimI-like enzyme